MCNGKGIRVETIAPGVHEVKKCSCHRCRKYRKSREERWREFSKRFEQACKQHGVRV